MRKAFFTRKRVRRFALIGGGLFALGFGIGLGLWAGLFPPGAISILDIVYNVLMGIGAVVLLYGVVMPVATTNHYTYYYSEKTRKRIRDHAFFHHFLIPDEEEYHE